MNRFSIRIDHISQWLSLSGVIAPVVSIGLLTVATLLTPGYDPVRDSISDLAAPGMPHTEIIAASIVAFGLLVSPMTWVVYRALARRLTASFIPMLIALSAIGAIAAGLFREESQEVLIGPVTAALVHGVATRISFSAMLVVIVAVAVVTRKHPAWRRFWVFSASTVALSLVFSVLYETALIPGTRGLMERAAIVPPLVWITVFSYKLTRRHSWRDFKRVLVTSPSTERKEGSSSKNLGRGAR